MMSQNNAIQEKEGVGSFPYTLYKNSGQISFNHIFSSILSEQKKLRNPVKGTFVIRTNKETYKHLTLWSICLYFVCMLFLIFLDNKYFISSG